MNGELTVIKSKGKVSELEGRVSAKKLSGHCGVGHTRWATHGRPSEANAHPHTSCCGDIAVVHNGIIENFAPLRKKLIAKGHVFQSETDTEVVAHLVEDHVRAIVAKGSAFSKDKILFEAVRLTLKTIEGAFAIGVLWQECPDTLVGARKHSPLIAGIGEGESFLASDVPAFMEYSRNVVFLNDGEIAVLKPGTIEVFNADGKAVKAEVTEIKWDRALAEKGGYAHFMLKEIYEQPMAVEETLLGRASLDDETFLREYGMSREIAKKIKRIQVIACGTAYHAGYVGKYAIEHFARVPVDIDVASEFRYRNPVLEEGTLIMAISQSGETADTLAAVRDCRSKGFSSLAVCNVVGSTLTRETDFTCYTHCGPEIGVASTKAFTGQLAALFAFALQLGRARGVIGEREGQSLSAELMTLPRLMDDTLKQGAKIAAFAWEIHKNGSYLFLGRNANFPIALEGALKLKEISYVHAEAFAGGEMKHGPIAIIEEGMPVIGIAVESSTQDKMASNLQEALARGARVIGILTDGLGAGCGLSARFDIPKVNEFFSPLLTVIPLQLFAYHVAACRGCEIDQPRNLAKSVTVE